MFIDASVIVAILGREPGSVEIEKRLASSPGPYFVSPLVKFEAAVALARLKSPQGQKPTAALLGQAQTVVEAFVDDLVAEEVTISADIGRMALAASAQYGKSVGHRADLNFGDCCSYACAKALAVPLLYKGNDFAHTDLA